LTDFAAVGLDDLRVDEGQVHFWVVFGLMTGRHVNHDQATHDADLWPGEPNAGRGDHGFTHVAGEFAQAGVNGSDFGRFVSETGSPSRIISSIAIAGTAPR
jgi:hypothetical protein